MAVPMRQLCRSIRQISRNLPQHSIPQIKSVRRSIRPFSSATPVRADQPSTPGPTESIASTRTSTPAAQTSSEDVLDEYEYLTPKEPYTASDLDPGQRADYDLLSKPDQVQYLKLENHLKALFESDLAEEELDALAEQADREIDREGGPSVALDFPTTRVKAERAGYWADEEEDEFAQMEDADDDVSDDYVSSIAESELDLHRDIREYTRIAAWDLPLLNQYAKPFAPPNHSTPLRFRYTTYMGESHPAARKVVVEFATRDLLSHPSAQFKISESQRTKLIKLVGVRYNPQSDIVKMSSEKYESPAQNKRYLGDLVGKLIKEAKDKRDEFKDVPFDFRHHKPVKKHEFPEDWKLTSATVQRLAQEKQQMLRIAEGTLPVDGARLVEQYVHVGETKQARLIK